MSKSQDTVPALRRAVRILDMVKASSRPPLAADVARQLDLPRSTVHGLLAVMVELGLLEKMHRKATGWEHACWTGLEM